MNVLFASVLRSNNKFGLLLEQHDVKAAQQGHKYLSLLARGIYEQNDINLVVVSFLSNSPDITHAKRTHAEDEIEDGIFFHYIPVMRNRHLKYIFAFCSAFTYFYRFSRINKDTIILCDGLNFTMVLASVLTSFLTGIKTCTIITDLPAFIMRKGILRSIKTKVLKCFDAYLLITKQMVDYLKIENKKHLIIEGFSDTRMSNIHNLTNGKYPAKVCMYAGLLDEKYGLKVLIEAFIKAGVPQSELHIYGGGDYKNQLATICNLHTNIKYFGIVPNDTVVQAEQRATLLINPRPSNEEFTKYSFPSKNIEYMSSGTPVLCTVLPGIPEEYYKYVFTVSDETVDGFAERIRDILSTEPDELYRIGAAAKDFVQREKNNVSQARKVVTMFREM